MGRFISLAIALLLTGCTSYGGRDLVPESATEDDVFRVMGTPSLRWNLPDGMEQLAYPRGPMGGHTFMVYLNAGKKLVRIQNVLVPPMFESVRKDMDMEAVLRTLGPPVPAWTVYFERRDELVWEWRYCDDWSQYARFNVLFDGTSGRVRSTMSLTEDQIGACGGHKGSCWCSR
jgi:hypothetical protein